MRQAYLVDTESGADPTQREFERDYYLATSECYRAQFNK